MPKQFKPISCDNETKRYTLMYIECVSTDFCVFYTIVRRYSIEIIIKLDSTIDTRLDEHILEQR